MRLKSKPASSPKPDPERGLFILHIFYKNKSCHNHIKPLLSYPLLTTMSKLQTALTLVNQVQLPYATKLAEALKQARHQVYLEIASESPWSPAIPYITQKDCIKNYEKLSPMSRSFMSKAHAEFKWAFAGKVYPYNDYTTWYKIWIS